MKTTPKTLQVFLPEGTPAGIEDLATFEDKWQLFQERLKQL